jgi:hypothetical protein
VRKILLLLFSIGLIGAGAYVLALCLAHPNFYTLLRGAFGAIFLIAMGVFLLWDDFLRYCVPGMKQKTESR